MKNILTILLILSLNLFAAEKKNNTDEIDHLSLAALLLKDGHIDRANDELSQVNLEDKKLDFIRFYTLKGLVLTKLGSYEEANKAFKQSVNAGQTDKSIYLYIAQNSFKLEKYEDTLDAIKNAGNLIEDKPSIYGL
ncbi:MAG: hypothetical protein FP820_09000, partial [Sulfurimonas sp.]|nr:hypothetical protein [Sulfurimonas sp.]MBU4058621.1 CDC27 family protein [bacterium]